MRKDDGSLMVTGALAIFGQELQLADAKAFARLMTHLKEFDSGHSTVIMVQVEDKVGLLGDSRDRSTVANAVFDEYVPDDLLLSLRMQ